MALRSSGVLHSVALSPRWLTARRLTAALLAAGALLLAVTPPTAPHGNSVEQPRSTVLVAARDLAAGVAIGPDDLAPAERTTAQLPDGALTSADGVLGRVVTGSVRRGEIITDRRLLGPGLSAGLGPGLVASPVRLVDLEVTALLRPGDRIDILAASEGIATASVVAASALVLAIPLADPDGSDGAQRAGPIGLVLVAVDQDTAANLAASAASSVLTATLLPP